MSAPPATGIAATGGTTAGGTNDKAEDTLPESSDPIALQNPDRALDEPLRRELNLIVARTLTQLRSESRIHLNHGGTKTTKATTQTIKMMMDEEPPPMILGKMLGQGGFSSVYEVVGQPTLACKFLSTETIQDHPKLRIAAADIVREGHFLAHLSHPNIIQLRGVGSLDDMSQYYLLLDKIEKPLLGKFEEWGLATIANEQIRERLQYAMSIVSAFIYLHSHNIVYRDLKVDNIGLDVNNQVLLYDFGLAKELKGPTPENGKYKLSGNTGTWAYMAPEVAKGYQYNLSVDVYSFGILLWELLNGALAFEGMSCVDKETRPPFLRSLWTESLELLLTDCWHWNPNNRPTFVQIEERLKEILKELPNSQSNPFVQVVSWMLGSGTK